MNILEYAIEAERGVGNLAAKLEVRQSVVSNWRARGLPRPWARVLTMLYKPDKAQPSTNTAQPATETVTQGF